MNIEFELREGRTAEDVYKDVAVKGGYKEKLTDVQHFEHFNLTLQEYTDFVYPDGVIVKSKRQTENADGTWNIVYDANVEYDNPVTELQFGAMATNITFQKQDAELEGEAATIRSAKAYSEM